MGYYGLGMAAPSFFLTLYVSIFNATNSINASHFTLYGSYNLEPRTSNLELKKTVAFAPTSPRFQCTKVQLTEVCRNGKLIAIGKNQAL